MIKVFRKTYFDGDEKISLEEYLRDSKDKVIGKTASRPKTYPGNTNVP